MSVRIVVDSTADLIAGIGEQVTVMPLTVRFGEAEYIDGVTINNREFYEKLAESASLPTTCQVTPFAFQQCFREIVEAGDQILAITLSAGLSGTNQSATIAAGDFSGNVMVVDSRNVAIGLGLLTRYAVEQRNLGLTLEELYEKVIAARDRLHMYAVLDTLEYLQKGGRISRTAAIAGSLLSIKPVIHTQDGELQLCGKARGSKQAASLMNKQLLEVGIDPNMPVQLGYSGVDENVMEHYINASSGLWTKQTPYCCVGCGVGTYAGPGAVAAAFFEK